VETTKEDVMRAPLIAATACCVALGAIPAAAGDGGPSPGTAWGAGISGPKGELRYVTVGAGSWTVVEAIAVNGGRVVRWGNVRGNYGIPYVTYGGTTGGLSRDGRTLVLASFASPPSAVTVTRFALFDTRRFRATATVKLRGSFSYDALSPDASTLFLIQYTSARDYSRYRVRAYDLRSQRLLPRVIVDRREADEQMRGTPVARATTQAGRWVYTLYARPSGKSFVHALDTVKRQARCLDLPMRLGNNVRLTLTPDERRLLVMERPTGVRLLRIALPSAA
jgi:hypothetical protein